MLIYLGEGHVGLWKEGISCQEEMEQGPWEGAVDKVAAVAAQDWVGWVDQLRQGRAASVFVHSAATRNLIK